MTAASIIRHLLAFVFIVSPLASANASAAGAQEFIRKVSTEALSIIKSDDTNALMKEERLSKLFTEVVDTDWIAKFVMGPHWREASDKQKEVYTLLHRQFLVSSYVPKFKEYTNQEVAFKKFYDEGNNEYLVETEIVQPDGGPSIRVDYKVRLGTDGQYHIFDVVAEGVSLITTQRSEFASILSRKGVDYLITKLKAKV